MSAGFDMRNATFAVSAAAIAVSVLSIQPASAQDLFALFDNAFGGPQRAAPRTSFAPDNPFEMQIERKAAPGHAASGGSYCVRTCDGRYFPLPASGGQSKAEACNSFCPASETRVFHGGPIDNAVTDNGKRYSDLPNAFRYRNELVSGCTCNGKDSAGLARLKIEDDRTVRRGDLFAGASGLMVVNRTVENRRASMQFSPASKSVQALYSRLPVVAAR